MLKALKKQRERELRKQRSPKGRGGLLTFFGGRKAEPASPGGYAQMTDGAGSVSPTTAANESTQFNADVDEDEEVDEGSILTPDEVELLRMFSSDLQSCKMAMRLQQVFCEGHNIKMQDYVFLQVDNSISINFVERTVDLILKLCPHDIESNKMDIEEMEVLIQAVDLIIELMQGPCERTQNFTAVSGLVEGIQKILRGKFELILELDEGGDGLDDPYPAIVRELKSKLLVSIQAMLELRKDTSVQKSVLYRCDPFTLKNRIIFSHRYFLMKVLKLKPYSSDPE